MVNLIQCEFYLHLRKDEKHNVRAKAIKLEKNKTINHHDVELGKVP